MTGPRWTGVRFSPPPFYRAVCASWNNKAGIRASSRFFCAYLSQNWRGNVIKVGDAARLNDNNSLACKPVKASGSEFQERLLQVLLRCHIRGDRDLYSPSVICRYNPAKCAPSSEISAVTLPRSFLPPCLVWAELQASSQAHGT